MMRRAIPAILLVGVLAVPTARGAEPAKAADTAEKIVAVLHNAKIDYEKDLKTTPLLELLDDLERKHGVKFIFSTAKFGPDFRVALVRAESLTPKDLNGMCLHAFLNTYLSTALDDATYVVRPDHIEITTKAAIREETGLTESDTDEMGANRLNLPLVCIAVKNKPLSFVLDELRRVYGLNIVVEKSVRELLKTPITEQLLNVPADTALELLAGQADLGVVRKGNTFRLTSNPGA